MKRPPTLTLLIFIMITETLLVAGVSLTLLYWQYIDLNNNGNANNIDIENIHEMFTNAIIFTAATIIIIMTVASNIFFDASLRSYRKLSNRQKPFTPWQNRLTRRFS